MKIPQTITKNNHKYIFIKEYENFILYRDIETGVNKCFSKHELGLNQEQVKASRKIKYLVKK